MLIKPKNYDEVVVNDSNYSPIELGGHKGIIMKAEEHKSHYDEMSIRVYVDTDKNDLQPNYFSTLYKNDKRQDKKWSNSGIKYVSLKEDEGNVKRLKAFITSVENSNDGFKFDWNKDVSQLNNKKVGLVYGLEEFTNDKGEVKTTRKISRFGTYNKIDNVQIPNVRLIDNSYIPYEEYKNRTKENSTQIADELEKYCDNVVEISADNLPF